MGDIDFDELDKAVNSLMGGVHPDKSAKEANGDKVNTLSIDSTLKEDEKPEYEKLNRVARKIGGETLPPDDALTKDRHVTLSDDSKPSEPAEAHAAPAVQESTIEPAATPAPAAKRPRSGRFMDMVHPSADMRSASAPALTVPPRSEPAEPHTKKDESDARADLAGALPQSPFLPDTKVEKRPLGGEPQKDEPEPEHAAEAPTAAAAIEPELVVDVATEEDSEEPVETTAINNEEHKVDDGSGDEQRTLDPTNFDVEAALQERKLQSIEAADATEPPQNMIQVVESGDTGKTVENMAEPASTDKSGDIYNVNEYHQPLAHPAKQKSGWGIVVIVAVIIILSMAAAGVAYFMFAKP